MKKLVSLFLALVMVLSITGVVAMATPEVPEIVIDGKKDADYIANRYLDPSCWQPWADQSNTTEPVDPERLVNELWFTWDDDFVYLYFQATSKDPLYQPTADQVKAPDHDRTIVWYEQVNVYLDTMPSAEYLAPCQHPTDDNPECNHFYCNANAGAGKYNRLMARLAPAWNEWWNYYRADEGMFLTYEQFCEKRGGEAGYEDLEAMYLKENGAGEAVGYVDYETNTYGFEMKYPRAKDEEYFKVNITCDVNETVWKEYGPELSYNMAICQPAWMNHEGMIQIWYVDYPAEVETPGPVNAVRRMKEELPTDLSMLELSHYNAVGTLNDAYNKLTDEHKAFLTEEEVAFIAAAWDRVNKLQYIAQLGDVNGDGKVNSNDALVALRAAVGKTELDDAAFARGEVTGDGVVNAKDALEMLQFTVGKRTEFTIARTVEL